MDLVVILGLLAFVIMLILVARVRARARQSRKAWISRYQDGRKIRY